MDKHGSFIIEHVGQTIVCHFQGAWNKEQALAFQAELKEVVNLVNKHPWCYVVNMLDFSGATPEAFAIQDETMMWCLLSGLNERIIIADNEIHIAIAKKYLKTFIQIPTVFIESIEELPELIIGYDDRSELVS